MSVQDLNRLSCAHALCEPADGQKVNTSLLSLGVQPPPHLLTAVVFRHHMRDTLTKRREYESTKMGLLLGHTNYTQTHERRFETKQINRC